MLSKNEIKWINSLKNKKYRHKHKAFLAEGSKLVNDLLLNDLIPIKIFTSKELTFNKNSAIECLQQVSEQELKKISCLSTPNQVVAVFEFPKSEFILNQVDDWCFVLDGIQDPGNLGTILRTLDWFGYHYLFCSHDTVDMYNPKVVQASMGAIGRVNVIYGELDSFLQQQTLPIYAADMSGKILSEADIKKGLIVLGNEGNGLSEIAKQNANQLIAIPKHGKGESLNVAMSAGIIASFLRMN